MPRSLTTRRSLLAAVALLAALSASAGRAAEPSVKTVAFDSPAVGRTMKFNVSLPADYESSGRRYPVVYLLHGLTSDYTAWARLGAPKAAELYQLIVVMPDAGNSWYVNWAESEGTRLNNWEDAIVKDLVGYVDSHYRTIARREGRAINGLSMGGYGGLTLGLRHPDMFASIGSESGALSFARGLAARLRAGQGLPDYQPGDKANPAIGIAGFNSQSERSPKGKIFTSAEQAESYDPFHLVVSIPADKLPHIYLDCGTDDRLLAASQEFAKLLMEKKIPFTFAESPGAHAAPYWAREINQALAVQAVILRRGTTE